MATNRRQSGPGGYVAVALIGLLIGRWSAKDPAPRRNPVTFTAAERSTRAEDSQAREQEDVAGPRDSDVSSSAAQPAAEDVDEVAAPSVYYARCADARAAGAAPIHEGEPGYAAHLDRDGDGVACE